MVNTKVTLCGLELSNPLIPASGTFGYGYEFAKGATTIWEHWDSYTIENGIRTGMNSFNHYSFGSCTEWMYAYCLGIRADIQKPGFRKLRIEAYPDVTGQINWAEGHYDSDFGRIAVRWDWDGAAVTYRAEIPKEIETDFLFPGMETVSYERAEKCHVFVLRKR